MLDLELNDEQEMLREAVRGLCADLCPLSIVRELEDDPVGYPTELWSQLASLDLVGLTLPEAHGGSGMTLLEAVVVHEELGRALAPTPHLVSAVLAAGAIARAGTDEQQARWLPGLASGETIATVAWLEPGGSFASTGVGATATPDGDDLVLDGTKWHVPFAAAADVLVVLARSGDGPADVDLLVVDRTAPGVGLDQQLTIASDTQYAVTFDGVRVPGDARLGPARSGWSTWHDVMLDGAIVEAAAAMGGAARALEITTQYAKDREQFGKPLGAFQAIAHYLADAKTAIDGGTTLVHEAAWSRAVGRDVGRLAPMAKLFCGRTYRDMTAVAQQIFGGVGFTVEYDIQLYFRRAKQLQLSWWDDRHCEELIAASVLDADELAL